MAVPFFNWDTKTLRWIYPAVTIPLTILTMGLMYALFWWRERKGMKLAEKARGNGAEKKPLLAAEEGRCGE